MAVRIHERWLVLLICVLSSLTLKSQDVQPKRLEKRTETHREMSSKYGLTERKKTQLYVVFSDSSSKVVTTKLLHDFVFQEVPNAAYEWRKYHTYSYYKLTCMPLFAAGFVGAINLSQGKNTVPNALIGITGLAGGALLFEYFNWKKQRHQNRLINVCNSHWSQPNKQTQLEKNMAPDALYLGSNLQKQWGVSVVWHISK